MLLCDASEAVNGKLYIMGGGWDHIWAPDTPVGVSVAVLVAVPWDQTNKKHQLDLALLTADGEPVEIEGTVVQGTGNFETGRPAGLKAGTAISLPMTFRFDGLALAEGGYVFELSIDGTVLARAPFRVQPPPGQ